MSNFRRRLMMNFEKKYTPVKYLESTGTQYIDSRVGLTLNTTIESDWEFTKTASDFVTPYGYVMNSQNNGLGIYCANSPGIIYTSFGSAIDIAYWDNILENRKYYIHNKDGLWSNGEKKVSYNNISVADSLNPIIIFARIKNNVVAKNSSIKLYLFKIYDNDILIRDYIPVIDSSNRPCLYDKVEDKFYYNEGSGEFLYE